MSEDKKTEEKEVEKKEETKEESSAAKDDGAGEEKKEEVVEAKDEKKDVSEEKKEEPAKKDESKEESEPKEVDPRFKEIIEKVEQMTAVDLADLVHAMEDRFGVSAAAAVAGPAAGGGGEEKSEYDVVLKDVGGSKINVIKAVKEVTGLGLKEAKGLVDNAPGAIKESVPTAEAEEMKNKLEEAGATVELE